MSGIHGVLFNEAHIIDRWQYATWVVHLDSITIGRGDIVVHILIPIIKYKSDWSCRRLILLICLSSPNNACWLNHSKPWNGTSKAIWIWYESAVVRYWYILIKKSECVRNWRGDRGGHKCNYEISRTYIDIFSCSNLKFIWIFDLAKHGIVEGLHNSVR